MFLTKDGIACVENDTHFRQWIEASGRLDHDWSILQLLSNFIDSQRGIVDVGANIGTHSAFYSRSTLDRVYSFEVNPVAYECLVFNCPKCFCIPFGLSDRVEIVSLVGNDNIGATHVASTQGDAEDMHSFPCATLDSFMLRNIGFIKLDVEGYEVRVVKGARKTLAQSRPAIWIEVNEGHLSRFGDSPQTLSSELSEAGYSPLLGNGCSPQGDVLFVPIEDIVRLSEVAQNLTSAHITYFGSDQAAANKTFIDLFSSSP